MKAINMGMDSNFICHAESVFINELKSLRVKKEQGKSLEQLFLTWLKSAAIPPLTSLSKKEIERRHHEVASINSYWLDNLPSDYKEFGGSEKKVFIKWRDLVLSGDRPAPINPKSDYLIYLLEEN